MDPAQATFLASVFWWTGVSVIVGLLVRAVADEASARADR
jgi:hypothetical protein